MSSSIPSYPKVYNLGHPALESLLDGPVVVQEKVDGSQFSFRWLTEGAIWSDGLMQMRSKGAEVHYDTSDKLFAPAVNTVVNLAGMLLPDHIYRGEVLSKPKHNTLAYSRTPEHFIVLFDVERPNGSFLSPYELRMEAIRIRLESVPSIELPVPFGADDLRRALEAESFLGGCLIEGVVIKNHGRWGKDGKFLAGKHVSEAFKETHKKAWKAGNPGPTDIVEKLIDEMRSPARWAKAVQHLRERGELTNSPQDIGRLIKEAQADLTAEEREYIAEKLLAWALPKVVRGATGGLAEWYKTQLMGRQFEEVS